MKKPSSLYYSILSLSFFILHSCHAQKAGFEIAKPELVQVSPDTLEQMNQHLHRLVDEKQLAGIQTAILRKGKLIHFDSYGFADIENQEELNEESVFRIFSMTKPLVSIALMQLYEQGKFKLEDPVHQYIPSFKDPMVYVDSVLQPSKNPVKIVDLLTHTAGYNYGHCNNPALNEKYTAADLNSATTNQEHIARLSKIPLQFEPGTDWQYGLSTNVCGYLIEVLSGITLADYLKEFIFDPLGMEHTYFQLPKEKINDFTVGYAWNEEKLTIVEVPEESRFVKEVTLFNGGGGLLSTTYDYLRFCEMLLDGGTYRGTQIIKKETLALMFKDHLAEVRKHQTERLRLLPRTAGFGLGFAIKGDSPEELETVYGWGGAVGTYFRVDTKNDLAYVMMIQISPYRHLGLRELFQDYVEAAIIRNNN